MLIRCDDDFEPAPDYVGSHIRAHDGSEPVGAVGLPRNRFSDTPYARVYGRPRDTRFRSDAYARPPEEQWRYWAGNCSLTRTTYERVGPYDTDYRAYGWEDVDYGYRLHSHGVPVRLIPEAEAVHHAAAVTTAIRMMRAFHSGAAHRLFDSKHPDARFEAAMGTAPASSAPRSVWERIVLAEASILTTETVERVGTAIDRALPLLPQYVAEKLVAAGVEASAVAGLRADEQPERSF